MAPPTQPDKAIAGIARDAMRMLHPDPEVRAGYRRSVEKRSCTIAILCTRTRALLDIADKLITGNGEKSEIDALLGVIREHQNLLSQLFAENG